MAFSGKINFGLYCVIKSPNLREIDLLSLLVFSTEYSRSFLLIESQYFKFKKIFQICVIVENETACKFPFYFCNDFVKTCITEAASR
jgi:hypothetical protein